jgi:hypothetical protein
MRGEEAIKRFSILFLLLNLRSGGILYRKGDDEVESVH